MNDDRETRLERELAALRERLDALEKAGESRWRFFVQYLLSPLLVVVIGLVFNWQLEMGRKATQQLEIAQSMLGSLFSDDEFRSLATQRLLNQLLEDEVLKRELDGIVSDYFRRRFRKALQAGDVDDAYRIYDAARSVGGEAGKRLVSGVEKETGARETLTRYERAKRAEETGFRALAEGRFDVALEAFAEAKAVYPDFHSVSEIHALLKEKRLQWDDPGVRRQILETVVNRYAWKAPQAPLRHIRQQLGMQ